MKKRFEMTSLREMMMFLGLEVCQISTGILLHQAKYVEDMLERFEFKDTKAALTSMAERPLLSPYPTGESVDQTEYISMIESLMYLTTSRSDIMFAVCQCARYQANPKLSHLNDVRRIFRYLKGIPKLGLWHLKNPDFDLYAFADTNYGGCKLDRKSTYGGCQFLGDRLVSWQCKKQQLVSSSTAEAEYVIASSCCFQVIWIQHQLMDYGLNFLETPIFYDNEAAIQIAKNHIDDQPRFPIEIAMEQTEEIINQMGYEGTFPPTIKKLFPPYWRFLAHVFVSCISRRRTGADEI
ncbi:uncharacterized mitochondrial protein AtMg00810-like [Lactuca sativa]|uniref:uncharacterized mitochondrial protein AtMg00810-like n=1 Tax=Lactuca sativa TaxID=4236 RepID=UPI000CD7EFC7|nr:uncharacterized mitochondrial protein AtMg00810-like [Lactuca sativa]